MREQAGLSRGYPPLGASKETLAYGTDSNHGGGHPQA